jgi:hypothetical protein
MRTYPLIKRVHTGKNQLSPGETPGAHKQQKRESIAEDRYPAQEYPDGRIASVEVDIMNAEQTSGVELSNLTVPGSSAAR